MPTVYLLCGLPGSGKTTYAKKLEKEGAVRLTLDEAVFERFGREYQKHEEKQARTKEALTESMKEHVASGHSVILDFGFWEKEDRDYYKSLVEQIGGEWKLLYFKVDPKVLKQRLKQRNTSDSENNHVIDEKLFDELTAEFEEPLGEGETIID